MTLNKPLDGAGRIYCIPMTSSRVLSKAALISEGKPREIESRLRRSMEHAAGSSAVAVRWLTARDTSSDGTAAIRIFMTGKRRKKSCGKVRPAGRSDSGPYGQLGFNAAAGTVSASPELFRIFGRDPGDEQLTEEMLGDIRSHATFRSNSSRPASAVEGTANKARK